jgi:hypothetical protein
LTGFTTASDGRVWVFDDTGRKVGGPMPAIEAHNSHGMTLMDCALCTAGEPMLHAFEDILNTIVGGTFREVASTPALLPDHDFRPGRTLSDPYCHHRYPSGMVCNLPAANGRHNAAVRIAEGA